MTHQLEITEYYELVALHKALMAARFAKNPLNPYISGSPYLADISKRIVKVLMQLELERGKSERFNDWQISISPNGEIWQIAVSNASDDPFRWRRLSEDEKIHLAKIILTPFIFSDELVETFVNQVDENTNK